MSALPLGALPWSAGGRGGETPRRVAAGRHICPEVWGGVECTVNRVEDRYIDQLRLSGHDRRLYDLERFASLGIGAIRYPVLWEHVAPNGLDAAQWTWSDVRLYQLLTLGISPIVGLLHHGSGPCDTGLLDPDFPDKFAAYARAVIERYPWVTRVTPINEPLTTARFSGLYGHWYPHRRDDGAFARMFLNQCHAIRAAMRAIRAVAPTVQLVQTEDFGETQATPLLQYQADFENHRRWLTFDMLCGRVTRRHPMFAYLVACGVPERELLDFTESPCPPDIIGINHYITSERYLDERVERYPLRARGGNGRHAYVDTEVARAAPHRRVGPRGLLQQVWERYHLPVAITEAHLGCGDTRQQVRWLGEMLTAACAVRADGGDVRAVTAWALLGSFWWDALVTRDHGTYEAGAFDVRGGEPRETAVAHAIRSLATSGRYDAAQLDTAGWWEAEAAALAPLLS